METRNVKALLNNSGGETITINKEDNIMSKADEVKMNRITIYNDDGDLFLQDYTNMELDDYLERGGHPRIFNDNCYKIEKGVEVYKYSSAKGDIDTQIKFRAKIGKIPYNNYATYEEIEELLENDYLVAVRGIGEIDSIEDLT